MTDTEPKPIRASEPAIAPSAIVSTASPTFHPIVAYSSRRARVKRLARGSPSAGVPIGEW